MYRARIRGGPTGDAQESWIEVGGLITSFAIRMREAWCVLRQSTARPDLLSVTMLRLRSTSTAESRPGEALVRSREFGEPQWALKRETGNVTTAPVTQ
jgi:hypothetical protein